MLTQTRPKRKLTGGRYKDYRKKSKYEKGNPPIHTKLGDRRSSKIRIKGGNIKFRIFSITEWKNTGSRDQGSIRNPIPAR